MRASKLNKLRIIYVTIERAPGRQGWGHVPESGRKLRIRRRCLQDHVQHVKNRIFISQNYVSSSAQSVLQRNAHRCSGEPQHRQYGSYQCSRIVLATRFFLVIVFQPNVCQGMHLIKLTLPNIPFDFFTRNTCGTPNAEESIARFESVDFI